MRAAQLLRLLLIAALGAALLGLAACDTPRDSLNPFYGPTHGPERYV